ncbi:MAG TPA: hypothetical protein VJ652_02120 [Noviherbaspirillum sp.]|nr:hypothetical protein [Noviherbaspirillum sp.]
MTTISGISSSLSSVFQLNQTSGVKHSSGQRETGEVQGDRPPGPPPGGGLADAIIQALSDIGVTGQSSTDSSSTDSSSTASSDSSSASADSQSIAQAFGAFMHNLIGALRSQSESGATADGSQGSSDTVAQTQGARHHHGAAGNIQSDLQSLIQKLSSSSGSTDSDSTGSTQSSLQQSFSNLLSTLGASNSDATVNKFLAALQSNLQGVTASGNIVNTTA